MAESPGGGLGTGSGQLVYRPRGLVEAAATCLMPASGGPVKIPHGYIMSGPGCEKVFGELRTSVLLVVTAAESWCGGVLGGERCGPFPDETRGPRSRGAGCVVAVKGADVGGEVCLDQDAPGRTQAAGRSGQLSCVFEAPAPPAAAGEAHWPRTFYRLRGSATVGGVGMARSRR